MIQALSRLWKFHGGLQLSSHKQASTESATIPAQLPRQLILSLQQHIGSPAKPLVAAGDRVLKGQLLARADGYLSAALHAPSSGTVTALLDHPIAHPSGLTAPCLVMETDGRDEWGPLPPPLTDYLAVDPLAIRKRVRESGIVGLGGAAFPSAVKLNAGVTTPIELLILNGAECEPYISCDDRLMRERPREIIGGLLIMRHALGAREAVIGIEDNKPQAYAALQTILNSLGDEAQGIHLRRIPTLYPSGGERQLIRVLTGREVPSHGIPADRGMVCHNVGTAAAVFAAVTEGRPLISRYVTVTGGGIKQPRVLDVLIGTPIRALIDQCGGYQDSPERLIMGGPMMGFALRSDAVPVVKGTNCILAATGTELAPPQSPMPCIRCGACMDVCPAQLLPQQLYWYAQAKDFPKTQEYHLFDCIECGCCAAVCPSHIPLVQYYRFAKSEIWAQEREREKADLARRRYQAHQERLERERQEKAARLRRKKEALKETAAVATHSESKKAAIEAAVARARTKKSSRGKIESPVSKLKEQPSSNTDAVVKKENRDH